MLSDAFVAADTGQATLLGLLDLTAAFDTVDHAILIERLRLTFGVVDSALHWMTSYLTGRTQYICYRGEVSTTTHVYCGVPQGSVLRPVPFLFYVADVIELVKEWPIFLMRLLTTFRSMVIVSRQTPRNWYDNLH